MGTFKLENYRKELQRKIKAIKQSGIRSSEQASLFMMNQAKRLAPRKSGETIRGIRRRKAGKGWIVESRVKSKGKTKFRQNMWTNQTAPHRSVRMWWNKGKLTVYGDGTHRITGTPRWFHFATLRTRPHFKKITKKNTDKALRGGLG